MSVHIAYALVLAALAGAMLGRPAEAQTPAAPAAVATNAGDVDAQIASIEQRLKAVTAKSAMLPQPGAPLPPPGTVDEWSELQRLFDSTELHYRNHIDALRRLKAVRSSRAQSNAEIENWRGFAAPPADRLDFVDGLWSMTRAKNREIEDARAELSVVESLRDQARTALSETQSALREAAERMERGAGSAREARLRWLHELSAMRVQKSEAWLGLLETARTWKTEALDWRTSEAAFLRRKAIAATKAYPLDAADRDAKLAALDAQSRALDQEIDAAGQAEGTAQQGLEAAQAQLDEARKQSATVRAADLVRSQQLFDARKAGADTAGVAIHMLRLLRQAIPLQQQIWRQRFELQSQTDQQALRDAMTSADTDLERLRHWRTYVRSALETSRAMVDALQPQVMGWKPELGDKALAESKLRAYIQRESVLRRILNDVQAMEDMLGNWREAMSLRLTDATVSERLSGRMSQLTELGRRVWQFELLVVEDKMVVEGREVIAKRSVTVGKVIEVLLILTVGLAAVAWLGAHGRRVAMRRLKGRESTALLINRIVSLLVVIAVVVFALVAVNIPLTAFAFLGGALAIGVGFGAQNILNNFISGLILLIEKPIKLGDVVDVEGVRGIVTDIGSRCSQVQRFDGVDMLIPNSSFLEKSVTNWTLSDQRSRFSLKVGIAYGSPTREATALLLQALGEHPEVLKDPAPQVIFEDFGDNTLVFSGDFWLNINRNVRSRRISSELRYRIEALFTEHHIVMAFPQRDVHFDTVKPIEVEVAWKAPGPRPSPG